MNNLSIATVLEKNRVSSENAMVFALEFRVVDPFTYNHVETVYLCNHTYDLKIDGVNYIRIPFNVDLSDEAGEIKNVTLTVEDQAGMVVPYLRKYRGMVDSEVKLSIVTVSPESEEAARVDFSELYNVTSSSASNYVISFELGAENPLTKSCPRRTQLRDRCSFQYKSEECGYTGDMPSCDLTLLGDNGCKAHGNTRRYGGSPSITVRNL
ncbi:hypothetical protein Q9X98_004267 [Vibrio parahaemolyticus]|uniref:hypothetical protein n=1 Tax=Vibrio alginolyticus TaxID=663 RepID=UPI00063D9D79|nr:hypothetical protein [Vibrio alginolyticus]EGR3221645.1 hypothetical protein [Vibrio parahaemolyticus]EHK6545758.1 hypothetical protein [Vibrio parahaemolyticus]EJL8716067.1 hypothetical protein [Vibrio alginolyticus]EKN4564890.1 hypothetical protein [Vibrio parahaemolyticus]ELA7322634.1 hypothetical protein [Vibrio parahaemolyticus]